MCCRTAEYRHGSAAGRASSPREDPSNRLRTLTCTISSPAARRSVVACAVNVVRVLQYDVLPAPLSITTTPRKVPVGNPTASHPFESVRTPGHVTANDSQVKLAGQHLSAKAVTVYVPSGIGVPSPGSSARAGVTNEATPTRATMSSRARRAEDMWTLSSERTSQRSDRRPEFVGSRGMPGGPNRPVGRREDTL